MQRYFVPEKQMSESGVVLTGEDVKHITRVMRMGVGDEIICNDGVSRTVLCKISRIEEEQIEAKIIKELQPETELPVHVTIAQGLPKGDKLEYIIQKGTEMGASMFLPFKAKRSVVEWDQKKATKKMMRLEKIAKEAAEQSYREIIPTINFIPTLDELIESFYRYDAIIVAFEESAKKGEQHHLAKVLSQPNEKLLVIIGPEGGFSIEEIERLKINGATLCGLGPRILRTETAPLYVLAAISYQYELTR